MIAAFTALEKRLKTLLLELDTGARAEYEALLAEVKEETSSDLARVRQYAGTLEADVTSAVDAAGPSVQAAVKLALQQFLSDLAPLLSEAAHDM